MLLGILEKKEGNGQGVLLASPGLGGNKVIFAGEGRGPSLRGRDHESVRKQAELL